MNLQEEEQESLCVCHSFSQVGKEATSTNKCCLDKLLTDEAKDVSDGGDEDH